MHTAKASGVVLKRLLCNRLIRAFKARKALHGVLKAIWDIDTWVKREVMKTKVKVKGGRLRVLYVAGYTVPVEFHSCLESMITHAAYVRTLVFVQ